MAFPFGEMWRFARDQSATTHWDRRRTGTEIWVSVTKAPLLSTPPVLFALVKVPIAPRPLAVPS